jgi:hypothetical protein
MVIWIWIELIYLILSDTIYVLCYDTVHGLCYDVQSESRQSLMEKPEL